MHSVVSLLSRPDWFSCRCSSLAQMVPPLARSTWPLIQAPSGPARKATALNVPLRLTAMWRSNGSVAHEGFMVVLEIVDRRLDLLTRLFHRAHSIDDMAKHRQGL